MFISETPFEEIEYLYYNVPIEEIIKKATQVCDKTYGNKVYLRGLIEFSNICFMDCKYCGIRRSNTKVERYRMSEVDILATIASGIEVGLKTFVLQSGENAYRALELASLVEKIKSKWSDIAVTLSCGYFKKEELKILKKAGVDRYLFRFEVADENLYSFLKNGEKLSKRLEMLNNLKELDFETGSGFMVGLPGETDEILLKNLRLCRDFQFDMVGIGPFIPHPDTPLKDARQFSIERTIKVTALLRLTLPYANIPATTAAGTLDPSGREKMLKAGANVLMPNITPPLNKKKYLLYPEKICIDESGLECIGCMSLRVKSVGKVLSFERGDSISYVK
ncbi:MAG: [FeFe] hydrogenase H-cluster radical SAM maturase HydE [Brevinematales bacterium]|nr:[FeFe] hydrogenase H-cluster radical SAM maturase HydE [Brevinematales bacterium]